MTSCIIASLALIMKRNTKPDSDRFACFADIRQIDGSRFLAFPDNQANGKELSREQMSVLMSCLKLKTIDAHAKDIVKNNLRLFLNRESDGKGQMLFFFPSIVIKLPFWHKIVVLV